MDVHEWVDPALTELGRRAHLSPTTSTSSRSARQRSTNSGSRSRDPGRRRSRSTESGCGRILCRRWPAWASFLRRRPQLLLDEPTVGLDVPTRRDIVEQVHALARDDGIAVLWATHLIDEISDDDDVMILHEGRILADGSLADILKKAKAEDIAGTFDALTGGGGR